MENQDYKFVNDETHQKGKKLFKTLAFIFLSVAVVAIICAIPLIVKGVQLGNVTNENPNYFELNKKGAELLMGGFVLMGMGGLFFGGLSLMMFIMAHQRELVAYQASSTIPVVGEGVSQMAQPVGEVVEKAKIAKKRVCEKCGAENSANAKFCKGCGEALVKTCPKCGKVVEKDSSFCAECGSKID